MKKIPILLTIMPILAGNLSAPVAAAELDTEPSITINLEANAVLQKQLVFTSWRVGNNSIVYDFNGMDGAKSRYGIWSLYIAGYDYNRYTLAEAEKGITKLGASEEKPDWAAWQYRVAGGMVSGLSSGTKSFGSSSDVDLRTTTGVIHYALQMRDNVNGKDNPEYHWYYGKIDFRKCAYNADKTPKLSGTCQTVVSSNGKYYGYSGSNASSGDYLEWDEEWSSILKERLADAEEEILAWDGDAEKEMDWRTLFTNTRATAADASEEVQILEMVDRLEELLARRSSEIEEEKRLEEERRQEEEQKRLEEERRQEEEQKRLEEEERKRQEEEERLRQEEEERRRQEEEEKRRQEEAEKNQQATLRPSSRPNSGLGETVDQSGVADNNIGSVVITEPKSDGVVVEVATTSSTEKTAVGEVWSYVASADDGEAEEEAIIGTIVDDDMKNDVEDKMTEEVAVPVLYSERRIWKWLLWPLIVGILMILCGILWKRRKDEQDR